MKKYLIAFTTLMICIILVVFSIHLNQDFFSTKKVNLQIDNYNSSAILFDKYPDLHEKLTLLKGKKIWDVSLKNVRDNLNQLTWIKKILISKRWPDTINIIVHPQDIKALILDKSGTLHPVVESGHLLDPLKNNQFPNKIILSGSNFYSEHPLRLRAIALINSLPKTGPLQESSLSEITYTSKQGFDFILTYSNLTIQIGHNPIDRLKIEQLTQVLNYLQQNKINSRVIDARFSKKILVRLHKAP